MIIENTNWNYFLARHVRAQSHSLILKYGIAQLVERASG